MSQSHDQRSHGLATDTPSSLEYTEGQHTPSNYGTYGTMPPELLYASPSLIPNANFHTDEQNAIIHAGLGVSFSGVPWFQCYELQEYYSPPAGIPVYDEWDNYPADSRSMVNYMPMRSVLNYRVDNPPWGLHSIGFGDSSAAIPQSSRSSSYTVSSVVDVTPAVSPCIGPAMEEPPEREGPGDLAGQSSVVVPASQRAHLTRNAVGNSQNPPTPNLRRKSKIEKRLQESQNGGSHIVFDSVEGRNCSAPRARYSASRRKEVAEVRKRGACFKCKMWKRKCDLGHPCSGCKDRPEKCSDAPPLLFSSQPCFRLDLTDCGFFRTKSASWEEPLRERMSWESDNAHELQVQFVYCDGRGPQFSIQCRRFKPEKTDIRTRKWGPGGHQILEIPTYCAQDIVDLRNQISRMVDRYKIHILSVVTFGSPDTPEVVVKTINMAMNRQGQCPLLKSALDIWAGSRFIAAPRSLRGKNTLGLKPVVDRDAHDLGLIPIPPMLDYQLDTIAIRWMENTMIEMLKRLWKTLLGHRRSSWFDVFLVIFILLNNLEYVYEAQLQYIQEHGAENADGFRRKIRETSQGMLKRWRWTAQHLTFVFKYHVKKCALDEAPLFSEQSSTRASDDAGLDEIARDYLAYMIEWTKNIEIEELAEISGDQVFQTVWCRGLVREWKKEQQ